MKTKKYVTGFTSAIGELLNGDTPTKMLAQESSDLSKDDFNRGWKDGIKCWMDARVAGDTFQYPVPASIIPDFISDQIRGGFIPQRGEREALQGKEYLEALWEVYMKGPKETGGSFKQVFFALVQDLIDQLTGKQNP